MLAIIVYVWFRFEWQFAVGTVIALLHDVLVTVGLFSLLQLDFDLSIVAALLTILGYSVNDSVVVSDRIRENLRKFKRMELDELLNVSINETLSRTILTGVTAIVGILALFIFGGEVIRNFTLRHAVRHHDRHLLVDLHRRTAARLPRRQARDRRTGSEGEGGGAGDCSGQLGRRRSRQSGRHGTGRRAAARKLPHRDAEDRTARAQV